jgi:prepilin-type N-terminal cleavage/methylation domain-containing protein
MTFKSQRGFTLIEILMTIAILAVVTVMSLIPINNSIDEGRFQETVQKMQTIRIAILGDLSLTENGTRTNFGFLGDIGAIPSAGQGIAGLIANPGLNAWSLNSVARFAAGWNGPYLTSAQAGANFTKDGWGRTFIYSPAATPPTIESYGADGVVGGTGFNSDIVVELPLNLQSATVDGFVSVSAKPYSGDADIEINYPDGTGALTSSTVSLVPADKGHFTFNGIPLGQRSVTAYLPNKAAATQTLGPALVTIDSNHFVIPNSALDTNSAGASSCNNLGVVTLAGGISLGGGGTLLSFNIDVGTNIQLQQVSLNTSVASTWNRITIDGTDSSCGGTNRLYPCPTPDDGTLSTITPTSLITAGAGLLVNLYTTSSISGAGTGIVQFNYNLGCDRVTLTGL